MSRYFIVKWLISLLWLTVNSTVFAGIDPPVIKALDGSIGQVKIDSIVTVEDAKYFDPAYNSLLIKPYPVKSMISVELNEAANFTIPEDFEVTVVLTITYTLADGSTEVKDDEEFYLGFDGRTPYSNRHTLLFDNAYRVQVKIKSLDTDVSWDVWKHIKVVNQLQAFPVFNFSCTGNAVTAIHDSAWAPNTLLDELPVFWTPAIGADEYDLEWTYIDSSSLARGVYGNPSQPDANLIFENNASRVTITGSYYKIPLLYDNKGHLFFRVRSVQWQPAGGRTEAHWSSGFTNGLGRFNYNGHERPLNWQATTSFAEDGKRKTVVQYFDGSLYSRQTVTKDNSTQKTVVTENLYDYQGRPVIQVLPAPTLNSVIGYTRNFNRGLNGAGYDKDLYDTLAAADMYCTTGAPPMSGSSGAAQYYSVANPLADSGFHKYIPDAEGYPFTEIEYTQDNTGRISRQGSTGFAYRIGGGHETKYFYGTPDQRELDALFGTEAGYASHYFKNMVRDANGQYSISYLDMHGRTVATAMAGVPPDSIKLDTLASHRLVTRTEKLSDPSSTVIKDWVMENKKGLLVSKRGPHLFNYRLDPQTLLQEGCTPAQVCYECLYDLQITITDDCNNQKLGGKPYDTLIHNFRIGEIDTSCTNNSGGFNFSFTKFLEEGSYEVTKKLSVSKYALDYYRDSIFMASNTCKTIDSFISEQRQALAGILNCQPTCKSCKDSLGTWPQFWSRFMVRSGIDVPDTAAYRNMAMAAYTRAEEDCAALCDSAVSDYTDIRRNMLMDMTPSSGQYANIDRDTDTLSVFFTSMDGDDPDTTAKYQRVSNYLDDDGNADLVFDEATGKLVNPSDLTPEVFAQKFKLSWAEALLPFHPEYCKLQRYEQLKASHEWDRRFAEVDTYEEARKKGYLNPISEGSFPARFNADPGMQDADPLGSFQSNLFRQKLIDSLRRYRVVSGNQVSLWGLASITVMCQEGSNNLGCFNHYYPIDSAINPTLMCTGELNMAWRAFRQMYLDVKRDIVNKHWIKTGPCSVTMSATALMGAGYAPHFSDAVELGAASGGTLPSDTAQARNEVNQKMNNYYDATCAAYATQWLQQLSGCTLYDSASLHNVIIPRLIAVCREGSDASHPYGASSVKPTSTHTFKSFEEVIDHFNDSAGIADRINCHAYKITAPKPYDRQAVYSSKPIYSKPDDCECSIISSYYERYKAATGYSSFSMYMKQVYQTAVSDSALNLLLGICNVPGVAPVTCSHFETALFLPPAFQCNTGDVCIDCQQFATADQAFKTSYPGITPVDGIVSDSAQISRNLLYEQFMNYRLGFAKTVVEYLAFARSCGIPVVSNGVFNDLLNGTITCDSLVTIYTNAKCLYESLGDPVVNTRQCNTFLWVVGGVYNASNTGVNANDVQNPQVISNGIIHMLYPDSSTRYGSIAYNSQRAWRVSNEYALEARVRNIGGTDVDFFITNHSIDDAGYERDEDFYIAFIPQWTTGYYNLRGVRNYDTALGGKYFNDWRVVKYVVKPDRFQVYYEGQLIKTVMRDGHSYIDRLGYPYIKGNVGESVQVDWLKMYGANDSLMFHENFDNYPAVINRPDPQFLVPRQDCEPFFEQYFNSRTGSAFNYQQIKAYYKDHCGIDLDFCGVDTIADCTFQKTYGGTGTDIAYKMQKTTDGGYVMAGSTNSFGNGGLDGYVVKTDSKGNLQWSKTYGGSNEDLFYQIKQTTDGGYIAVGSTRSFHQSQREVFVVKMNAQGNVTWSKGLAQGTGAGELAFDVIQTSDGGYVISGMHNYTPGSGNWELIRLAADGSVLWGKMLGTNNSEDHASVVEDRDTLVVTGAFYSSALPGEPFTYYDGLVMKINKANGNVIWTRTYNVDAPYSSRFAQIYSTSTGYKIMSVGADAWGTENVRISVVELDKNGGVIRIKRIQTPANSSSGHSIYPTGDGGYIATQSEFSSPADVYWHKTDASGNLQWTNRVRRTGDQYIHSSTQNADGSFAGAGADGADLLLMKVSNTGKSNCSDTALNFTNSDLSFIMYTQSLQVDNALTFSNTNITVTALNAATTVNTPCIGNCFVPGITLCGRAEPVFPPVTLDPVDNCSDTAFFIASKAQELYKVYIDSLKGRFDSGYIAKCLSAYRFEQFTVRHEVSEYHYTLYYYDQAGNLVKTVPPAGVQANYDSLWLDSVETTRLAGGTKVPVHTLITQYRYNSLNQLVSQKTPDAGKTEFWYDRLGRLALRRNAQQKAYAGGKLFSYTRYDIHGRVAEVGQIRDTAATTPVNEIFTRNQAALSSWFTALANYRGQVTVSTYDLPYTGFGGFDSRLVVQQQNLRNRISFVSYADSPGVAAAYNNAVFYSYDLHGNIDTLLQDYGQASVGPNIMNTNNNRFKKLIYQYDLASGKVNMVMYQRGWSDEWFHRYQYDAENRITGVETSLDSFVWEKDVRYEYYRHGPLARTVLGHQQVQGIDYAYTLQGWIKGVNSTGATIAHDMGGDGSGNHLHRYTARDAFGFTLNYFAGEYKPIGNADPFPGYRAYLADYRPLFNGDISSLSVYNRRFEDEEEVGGGPLLFYNYRYDQLHRLTGQDAYRGFDLVNNSWSTMTGNNDYLKERIAYDGNGNILKYLRNAMSGYTPEMDSLSYFYYSGTNKLRRVKDIIDDDTYRSSVDNLIADIDNQADTSNYIYDEIGNLIKDKAEGIVDIKWSVYGKILEITRNATAQVPVTHIRFTYDALGHRIGKVTDAGGEKTYTWYVRDMQGNILTTYTAAGNTNDLSTLQLYLDERYVYGNSRVGMYKYRDEVSGGPDDRLAHYDGGMFDRGFRQYELSNHLGNVLATISDKKFGVPSDTNNALVAYYEPDIRSASDYYPFGMMSRVIPDPSDNNYRFGFNGKETDHEVKGAGNQQDYGMRIYDPRIGRFLSEDPLTNEYPWYTPYQFAGNKPISFIDLDGLEEAPPPTPYRERQSATDYQAHSSEDKNDKYNYVFKDEVWPATLERYDQTWTYTRLYNGSQEHWWLDADKVWHRWYPDYNKFSPNLFQRMQFVADASGDLTFGGQIGAKAQIGPVKFSGELNGGSVSLLSGKFGKNPERNSLAEGSYLFKDGQANYTQGAKLQFSLPVKVGGNDIGIGGFYERKFSISQYGTFTEGKSDYGVNLVVPIISNNIKKLQDAGLGSNFDKVAFNSLPKGDLKANYGKKFVGLDLAFAAKFFLGAEVKLKLGFMY